MRSVTAVDLEDRVLAEPEADGPRFVVADWWQQRGDPRGAFVHAQMKVAERGFDGEWARAWAASERLRLRFEPERLRQLREICAEVAEVRYARGFVDHIGVVFPREPEGDFLPRIAERVPLRSVSLTFDELPVAGKLVANVERAGIRRLSLEPAIGAGAVPEGALSFVEALKLPRVGPAGLRAAARMWTPGRLSRLGIRRGGLDDDAIRALQPVLPDLEELDLTAVGATPDHVRRLASTPSSRPIALSLASNTALRTRALTWIDRLFDWRPLEALDLRFGSVNEAALRRILVRPPFEGLTALGLSGPFPRRRRLLGEIALPRLRRLSLGPIGGPPVAHEIAEAPDLHRLLALDLGGNRIRDAGVAALVDAPFDRLVELDLSDNRLTDESLRRLAAWPALQHVVRLRLDHNPDLTADGWRALAAAPHFDPAVLEVGTPVRLSSQLWDELVERFGAAVVEHVSRDRPVWSFT